MACLFIDRLSLGYGQCSLFLPRLLFSTWGCWKEDWRNMILSLRLSQMLCYICLQQKLVKLPLQLWRYRCVAETWLLWAAAMWSSNGANDVCSSFNFAAACASLWVKQSKKANNIIRLAWISTALKGIRISLVMAGGAFPQLLVAQLILTGDQIILLDLVTP